MIFTEQETQAALDYMMERAKARGKEYAKLAMDIAAGLPDVLQVAARKHNLKDTPENVRLLDDALQDAVTVLRMGSDVILSKGNEQ